MLQISNHEYGFSGDEPPSASVWTLPTAVLVTQVRFSDKVDPEPLPTLSSHVRVAVVPEFGGPGDIGVYEDLCSLCTLAISLKTLVLPSFLRRLDDSMSPSRYGRDYLLKVCTTSKIEVVWHDEEGELSFSKAFWAYAKRLKADEAAAARTSGSA